MSDDYTKMKSYEITEYIRNISKKDTVKVYYRKGRFENVKSVELEVYEINQGDKPYISCWEAGLEKPGVAHSSKYYNLELYKMQAGYKLRNISNSDVDGSKIISIKNIEI